MTPDKINKVAAVAKVVEQKSAQEFSASQQSHQEQRAQLEQLLQFKADYEASLEQKSSVGMAARQLQDYRLFLGKLNQAIELQVQEVQRSQESLASVRAEWIEKSQRTSAMDHLVDERQRQQQRLREKIEQKESDEQSMNRISAEKDS